MKKSKKTVIRGYIHSGYNTIDDWLKGKEGVIKKMILGSYASIDIWLNSKKSMVEGWVKGLFPYTINNAQSMLKWLGIDAGEVITTILDTPKDMLNWISNEMQKKYTVILETKNTLVEASRAKILGTFATIDKYLDAQRLKIEIWISDSMESILDRVFKI